MKFWVLNTKEKNKQWGQTSDTDEETLNWWFHYKMIDSEHSEA